MIKEKKMLAKNEAAFVAAFVLAAGSFSTLGCNAKRHEEAAPRVEQSETVQRRTRDEELRPSTVLVAGLPIPNGFVRVSANAEGLQRFRADGVDAEQLRRYIADRVEPAEVHAFGPGTTQYARAKVRALPDDGRRVDILVVSASSGAELQLLEIAPLIIPPGVTSDDREREVREAIAREAR